MRILVIGDTHGNTKFLCDYLYPIACNIGAGAIVQLGDFGYWEQAPEGVQFLDDVAGAAHHFEIPLYWLHGNHDKHSMIAGRYTGRTVDGFIAVRPRVNYIPQGFCWTWAGVSMRAFGGAYSVDKQWRLDEEAKRYKKLSYKEGKRRAVGLEPKSIPPTAGTLWFPEEQMTDAEFAELLAADSDRKDIVFSHDKPRGSNPGLELKNEPECLPNQDRLQRALCIHKQKLWLHGHLHHRYTDWVRYGDGAADWTRVAGLGPDSQAAMRFWRPTDSWCVLDLHSPQSIDLTPGADAEEWYEHPRKAA